MSKIMYVFYGVDRLPYKDQARSVHFPIIGQTFNGASNVDEIRFYVDQIGGTNDFDWLSTTKLPNGKKGYKLLTKGNDTELGEKYVSLSLNQFYTQYKGDIYISISGYQGGVVLEEIDTDEYELKGTPTIQATGSVKITIQYAPQLLPSDIYEYVSLDDILAYISGKADVSYVKGNYVPRLKVDTETSQFAPMPLYTLLHNTYGFEDTTTGIGFTFVLEIIDRTSETTDTYIATLQTKDNNLAKINILSLNNDKYYYTEVDDFSYKTSNTGSLQSLLSGATFQPLASEQYVQGYAVAKTTTNNTLYGVNGSGVQTNVPYSDSVVNNNIVKRNGTGQILVPTTPTFNTHATSKEYVDTFGKSIEMTIDSSNYQLSLKLKDKNGNQLGTTQVVDLPLESIIVSATYYDSYTYGGTTYSDVIVIVLATTDVPTIVPVGNLISGLVDTTTDQTIGGQKTFTDTATFNEYIVCYETVGTSSISTNGPDDDLDISAGQDINFKPNGSSYKVSVPTPTQNDTFALNSQLSTKENTSNKVSSISSSSTDTQYPTAKLLYDQLALKENVSNKVITISASSTDTQYPSAKCVYEMNQTTVAIANGKTKTYIITCGESVPMTMSYQSYDYIDDSGNIQNFASYSDMETYMATLGTMVNSSFNSQNDYISFTPYSNPTNYVVLTNVSSKKTIVKLTQLVNLLRVGDNIYITETTDSQGETIPDRWVYSTSLLNITLYKLETTKPNLNNYYTKTQTDSLLSAKQNTLVSGTNIKTINGTSILGSGDLTISGSAYATQSQINDLFN